MIGPTILPIPNYDHYYADILGNIYSNKSNEFKILSKNIIDKCGHQQVYLSDNGKTKALLVHRLVYETFVGSIPDDRVLDHIDRDPLNNGLTNIRLVTRNQNAWNNSAKNYCFHKANKSWVVYFTKERKKIFQHACKTEEEAKKLADKMRPIVFGEFARKGP